MKGKPTLYDVAADAGVSIATVSFAFTKPSKVKADTLERVLASATSLGYVPSANARGLARGRTGAVGLYAFDYLIEHPGEAAVGDASGEARLFPLYSDEVQRGVALECRSRGYALMIGAGTHAAHLPDVIDIAGRVDGLITFARALSAADLAQVSARMPVIELGGEHEAEGVPTVRVDNTGGMTALVSHLVDVHGCRDFAYIGATAIPETAARYEAFCGTLRAAGLDVPPERESSPGEDGLTATAVRELLASGALPDAVVCSSDQEALIALDELRAAGVRVPEQVAVTGFDGILAGRLSSPALTTVRQPMEDIGRAAVRSIARALGDTTATEADEPLACVLTVRASCGC